jgi:anti-anti-sigma factor
VGGHVVIPAGTVLGTGSTDVLAEQLGRTDPGDDVLVDFSSVTFCDTQAIGLLIGAWRRHRDAGGSLHVVSPAANVAHVFTVMGVADVLLAPAAPALPLPGPS